MSGIYIHIPFCKQACHYCDFHFSTSLKKKEEMLDAILQEIVLRKTDWQDEPVETIYFGGGTPSILSNSEIEKILQSVYENFSVVNTPEITLEANPDDLTKERIIALAQTKINRLSVGVQSFFEEDLQLMNRAHNADEAWQSLDTARTYFDNISIDLIYGIPGMSMDKWQQNIEKALTLGVPHISSYALTVEPKTALAGLIVKGMIPMPDDGEAHEHFLRLMQLLKQNGYVHYELSNFGKPGYFSQNNTAYWMGKKYMGIGPSAHSFDGVNRSWNISNNTLYLKKIQSGILPSEREQLSVNDRYNEYIMTGLRTMWGVSLQKVQNDFGEKYLTYLLKNAQKYIMSLQLVIENNVLKTTAEGKFFGDGIASELFMVD